MAAEAHSEAERLGAELLTAVRASIEDSTVDQRTPEFRQRARELVDQAGGDRLTRELAGTLEATRHELVEGALDFFGPQRATAVYQAGIGGPRRKVITLEKGELEGPTSKREGRLMADCRRRARRVQRHRVDGLAIRHRAPRRRRASGSRTGGSRRNGATRAGPSEPSEPEPEPPGPSPVGRRTAVGNRAAKRPGLPLDPHDLVDLEPIVRGHLYAAADLDPPQILCAERARRMVLADLYPDAGRHGTSAEVAEFLTDERVRTEALGRPWRAAR